MAGPTTSDHIRTRTLTYPTACTYFSLSTFRHVFLTSSHIYHFHISDLILWHNCWSIILGRNPGLHPSVNLERATAVRIHLSRPVSSVRQGAAPTLSGSLSNPTGRRPITIHHQHRLPSSFQRPNGRLRHTPSASLRHLVQQRSIFNILKLPDRHRYHAFMRQQTDRLYIDSFRTSYCGNRTPNTSVQPLSRL
jgi:hypothetical protein